MSMLAVSQNVLPPETNVCYNCFRTKDGVCVVLHEVARDENIRMKLKFCNVKDKRVDKTPDKRRNYNKMFLCMECETYLTNKQHGNEYCYYWPALCWRILICDRVVRNCVFAHFAWQMLPRKWRIWWLAEVKKIRRIETVGYRQQRTVEVYEDVTLDYPAPFFDDVTDCYLEILDVEKELDVTKLLQYWDDFCAWPSVKCPWGCTEFLSDCGMIAFDDVYSHFCDPFAWCSKDLERTKTCGESKRMDKLLGARPDFLQSIGSLIPGAEDCMLIKRCIVIDKCKGPCVMTCKDHNGGSTEMYIHPPTNPATLQYPSCHGDQLAPAVFMPRLIRNFKKRGFSNTYQVHQIHSGYNGIDTCNIQEMGMFDITSDILYKNEGLIVANRSDLKNHVHFLHKQGILNQTAFDEIMASGESWADGSREKDKQQQFALSGSTMLTFVDALQLQEVLSHPHVCSNLKRIHYNGYDEAIVRRHVFPVALLGGGQDTDHVNNDSNILEQQCGLTITRQQRVDEDKNMSVSSSSSSAHSDSSGHEDRDRTRKQLNCPFRPIWPPALFQVHPYSAHGASPLYSKSIWHLFQENDTEGSRPHYANLNPCINSYGYVPIPIQFDPEAEKILLKLGMLKIDPIHKRVIPNDTRLEAGIHVYPTNHDFHFSPVNPALFAIFQSTMNLQICDKSLAARYLTNYTSRVDTRTRAVFSSNQQTGNVQVQIMDIPTTKIASNRNQENQAKLSDRIKEKPQGVLISLPEMFRRIFNKKQIICTETFTAFPTLPLEERVGMLKRPKLHFATATDCINYVYENRSLPGFAQMHKVSSIETRRTILKLSIDRQFSASQELLIRDQYSSPVTIDNITAHGIRPPELRQFYFPQHYVQYFYWKHPSVREKTLDSGRRVSITEQLVGHDIFTSAWIDGMERQVFVRKAAIDVILSTYSSKLPCDMMLLFHALHYLSKNQFHLNATEEMQQSVILKLSSQQQQDSTCISTLFLTKEDQDDKLPLPVIIPVKPNRPQKFLISLILSLGHFDNEIELWHATSLHEVFYNASLIPFHPSVRLPSLDEIDNILKMYVDRFLLYIPASWHTLNKYLIMAQSIIKDALHHNAVLDLGIPGNTYSSLYQIVTNECQAYIQQLKRTLVETLTVMIPHGPTIEEFMAATKEQPLQWEPTFRQVEGQSDDSYHEQQMAFNFIREKIDAYCKCQRIARRGTILHGHAGSGKTTIQSYVILYQISRGLLSTSTALASKRSRENGGIHIHQLLKIINSKRATTAAGQYSSDKVIDHLWKYPEVVNYLRTMDCLNLDEGGQTDAELFSVIDSALRYIRNSSDYFGGILSTITIDINQCGTMNNTRPLWCSPNIITSYDVIELQGFVRSCQDNPQQELILISEKTVRTMQDKQLFHDIIASHCQWYASWSDASISSDMLRIFGKRAAVNKHENEFIDKHIRPNNISVVIRRSEDEECIRSLYNQWSPATPRTSTKLNALVKEQNSLLLYYNAVVELTFNKKNHWDQGQVAIIRSHITQEDADHWAPVLIAVAKVGTNIIPSDLDTVSNNDLCEMGWTFETVSKHQTQEQTISLEVLGRRTQYPFRSRNASTIHKVMGSTLYKGITQVSNDPSSDYYLWEKGLVVVLLTRFRQLKHLAFVDPLGIKHTTDVLLEILDKVPSYYYHSKHVLDNIKKTFHRHDNIDVQQQQSNAVVVGSMTTDAASSSTIPSLSTMIPEINLNFFPYCPKDYPISTAQATPHGFLYMLLSLADRRSFYIGQTTDLRKRLHAHNKILSASGADPRYRPWVPLVYFTGFQSSTERRAMEHKWQQERNRLLSHDSNTSIMDVINIGIRLCSSCRRLEETPNSETFQDHEPCLVLHRCYSAHVA